MSEWSIEAIRELTDPSRIAKAVDDLRIDIAQIEAQLEWRESDEDGWEARAVSALGFRRQALGEALRHQRQVTGDRQKLDAARSVAKAARKEAAAASRAAEADAAKVLQLRRRNDLREKAVKLVEGMNFDAAFRRAARKALDEETFEAIERAAMRQVNGVSKSHIADAIAADQGALS